MSTFEENLDDIYKYDTESLIEFLRNNIQIKEEYFDILRDQEITGSIFFKITEETFRSYGLKGGKFNIYGSSLSAVPQFTPSSLSLTNDDDELQQCMNDIKRKLRNLGTLIPDSNEAMRNEYISAILHAAIHIARRETDKEISLLPQLQIVGDENCGRVDYTIISLEELICITESKRYLVNKGFIQNVIQCESALQTNRKKRKAGVAFWDCEYLYGAITTATDWYFLSYSPEKISCSFKEPIMIKLSERLF
ncbi:hypothetical protein RhiirA1_392064 [Rhizophagus irregularis]|uniref:Uncharacterized protein n=3 Tax=Rhizophagus irregularis TaxID=588596 RepID=A0A2I1F7D3_9GLOM|nr:hypothetical protein GLOIN_2v1476258 [Rhizophagus irregularis DAOM 181602=DAOM 197198]EXX69592.1 hypothetical protein RirG_094590 [Rhizophagus irregularis DAOM 197198w]PKC69522.1 hypothetical protein RhiirA1_392064 [Rhizophagus irregularis]PKY30286.1 hypothetical protein RhiirB3_392448 [Rhizophagus irregularis]POG74255.1 hypothetical protein GLOIN_2v1476258 [Rhizophagus irregularis DAOM 181602=DAOM 197198]CAB4488326.1 unnamed protein product [Rhizophagus irregularis]|eukprot:XP_025181121.1 hypothetical protein GLOIN_2v1476258 [Rhizophagus irregularis DAOM 181602=DAOM 197198]